MTKVIPYKAARRRFQQVYGPRSHGRGDPRFDRVDSCVGRGKNFDRFLSWGKVPDAYLPDVLSLVPRLSFNIVNQAVEQQRDAPDGKIDWSAVCMLHTLALHLKSKDNEWKRDSFQLNDKSIPPRYRSAVAVSEILAWKRERMVPINIFSQLCGIAAEVGLKPLDLMGLLTITINEKKDEVAAFKEFTRRIAESEYQGIGFHPLVRALFLNSSSQHGLAWKLSAINSLGNNWHYLPLAETFTLESLNERLARIPQEIHSRIIRSFSDTKCPTRNLLGAVEAIEGSQIDAETFTKWGGVDLMSYCDRLSSSYISRYRELFEAGYFQAYLVGEYFHIVPLPSSHSTLLVLRLNEGEHERLEEHGYFYSYRNPIYLKSMVDIFAVMLTYVDQETRLVLNENQSDVWHLLPPSLRERYRGWALENYRFGVAVAQGLNVVKVITPTAEWKSKWSELKYPSKRARQDYDDPAQSLGFEYFEYEFDYDGSWKWLGLVLDPSDREPIFDRDIFLNVSQMR